MIGMIRWARLILIGALTATLLGACIASPAAPAPAAALAEARVDLSSIKTYLLGKNDELKTNTTQLKTVSDRYYALAQAAEFDYVALWQNNPAEIQQTVEEARQAWIAASPIYEQMEGIVAGVPTLAEFDVILDAGASGAEDPENAVPFDLTLPDGRVRLDFINPRPDEIAVLITARRR